jgi:hypothetical protein
VTFTPAENGSKPSQAPVDRGANLSAPAKLSTIRQISNQHSSQGLHDLFGSKSQH